MKANNTLKALLVLIILGLIANAVVAGISSWNDFSKSESNIVTVDVDTVFENHKGRLNRQQEIDEKAEDYTKEIEALQQQSVKRAAVLEEKRKTVIAITDQAEKAEAEKALVEEIKGLREFEVEVSERAKKYKKVIEQESVVAASGILEEIYEVVERKSKALGYKQVINAKALDKNGVPVLLFNYDVSDFTSLIIEEVNKGK